MQALFDQLCQKQGLRFKKSSHLTGGDINEVILLETSGPALVLKLNESDTFPGMFAAEAHGLNTLATANSFRIPKVFDHGELNTKAFLLMEYIPAGSPSNQFWQKFAENLTQLHQQTRTHFGLDRDNYIGNLPQQNNSKDSAVDFYIEERLEPQFKRAWDSGYRFKNTSLYQNMASEIPEEPPALIHGDLWNGNFLCDNQGDPVLIDPAIAYAPREMDLGMMQLFGGFPPQLYQAYNELFPLAPKWEKRTPIWQLYYLLVHLNLFGQGYYQQVKSIVSRYS